MPVYKYRDVSEMGDTWYEPGDPRLFEAIRAVWSLAARLRAVPFRPGVYKHRSIEDANALREEWTRANVEATRARRHKGDA